jgi:transketolase
LFSKKEISNNLSKELRQIIIKVSYNSGQASHIGGALSIVEILISLYKFTLKINLKDPKDRFILSKGHGFLGLLSILFHMKFISKKELYSFQKNGSEFIAHPIMKEESGIETSNGSLGQGLSYGVGLSIAYKKKNKKNSIYILLGDGECYEGSVWEAAITATENNLDNLVAIIDCNGYQNDGKIGSKMDYKNIYNKWKGFGWNTIICDGHDVSSLVKALKNKTKNKPTAIIAKTIKGKGVGFMENNNDWHHGRITKLIYEDSIKEIKNYYDK